MKNQNNDKVVSVLHGENIEEIFPARLQPDPTSKRPAFFIKTFG